MIVIDWTSTFNRDRPSAPRTAEFATVESATRFARRLAATTGTLAVQITSADGVQAWTRNEDGSWDIWSSQIES
jgi:hypothetical protein